jgi:hypothetical protein
VTKQVLLDEGVPRHLAEPLRAAGFPTTPYPPDWKQMANGDLLTLAEERGFDVLITGDKNIYAQQNLQRRRISIIVLPTNLRRQVLERAKDIAEALSLIEPRQYVVLGLDGSRSVVDFDAPRRE